jgi:predicted solute-binding protein
MVYAVWACRREVREGLEALERAHLRSLALARGEPEALARAASEQYGWPAGFLARYFEKLRYHFGPRERAGLIRFFELAHLAGELDQVPELRFVELESVTP